MEINSKKSDNNKLPILFENSPKGDFLFKLFLSSILWCFLCITINFIYTGYDWAVVYKYLTIVFFLLLSIVFFGGIVLISIAIFCSYLLDIFNNKNSFLLLLVIILINTACFFELISCFTIQKKILIDEVFFLTLLFGGVGLIIFIVFHAIISPILNFILKVNKT